CLGFVDDFSLLALDMKEVRSQITNLQKIALKIGLQVSFKKTEIMPMKPLSINKVFINDEKINVVLQFQYLREIIKHNLSEKAT
ncbi:MAG: hypothetical protein ACTS79_04140, partial [Arsenophonus sp. ET-KM2-MAG3]